jgi:hypothetical protein
MDFNQLLGDTGTVIAIASGIVIGIQFLKMLFYKLPWAWVQKTPGEVWFALSIAVSIGVVIALNYNVLMENGVPLFGKLGVIISGLTVGAGSKLVHAVATSAGAKLNEVKVNSQNKIESPVSCDTGEVVSQEAAVMDAATPVFVITPENIEEFAEVYKKVPVPDGYYVRINDTLYQVKKEQ